MGLKILIVYFYVMISMLAFYCAFIYFGSNRQKKMEKVILYFFPLLPIFFLFLISWRWSMMTLQVPALTDIYHCYRGIADPVSTPYRDVWQVESPTFFALMRAILFFTGDSLESYARVIKFGNWMSLSVFSICLVIYLRKIRPNGFAQWLNLTFELMFYGLCGLMLFARNYQCGNFNCLTMGFVGIFILVYRIGTNNKILSATGGMALASAIMLKPYYLMVLIILTAMSAVLRKSKGRFSYMAYAAWAWLVLGGCLSLLAPGIDVSTYFDFLRSADALYHSLDFQVGLFEVNNSLIKYISWGLKKPVSLMIFILCSSFLIYLLRKKRPCGLIPIFFLTQLYLPVFWQEHLMGIFPAVFFLMSGKREARKFIIMGFVATLVFFASMHLPASPFLVNLSLIMLFLISENFTSPKRTFGEFFILKGKAQA
ncbi:hypothetical protein C4569_01870 [Candidatus Parcubacteria bacterium]|nr:MAG: hypothetical protein C4569_01870 [Candidatus Parcubacteria bacterium]